jgi:hypothetical protein
MARNGPAKMSVLPLLLGQQRTLTKKCFEMHLTGEFRKMEKQLRKVEAWADSKILRAPAKAPQPSDLELDADFHDLSAWNLEICARPLGVVVHEREQLFPPARHARPTAFSNDRLMTGVVDHSTEIALRNLPARHRDIESVGNVGLLHEAEAQLDASDTVGDRRDLDPIIVRDAGNAVLRNGGHGRLPLRSSKSNRLASVSKLDHHRELRRFAKLHCFDDYRIQR